MKLGVCVAAAWLAGGTAVAAEQSKSAWATYPSVAELSAAMQPMIQAGIAGRAVAQCSVLDDGVLDACKLILNQPAGSGYGAALLALTPKYKRKPPGKSDTRAVAVNLSWYPIDTAADWSRKPSPEELFAVYPRGALQRGVGGHATVSCLATAQGALRDCIALDESPADIGFGSAAVALTPQFMMRPATLKGTPVPSMVSIPITWPAMGAGVSTFGSKKVVPPDLAWAEAPSYADVAAAYPKKARAEKLSGRATLACDLSEEGRLVGCDAGATEPRGYGFDVAAKGLAKMFRFQVGTEADRKATHSITMHVPFVFDASMLSATTAPQIGKPRWASLPTAEQTGAAFRAVKVAGTARTVMECTVQPGGSVGGCRVVSETPAGTGMGPAAMTLAPFFRLTTWTAEGLPIVGGTVSIPLRYDGQAAAAAK